MKCNLEHNLRLIIYRLTLIVARYPMPTKKKGKKGKNGKKGGKKKEGNKVEKKVSLSKEQLIEKSISDHMQIIQMMWNFILGELSEDEKIREKMYKMKCETNGIIYIPRSCIQFDKFQKVIEQMTDINSKAEAKKNAKLNIMLDVFEWFDLNNRGTISYSEFQQRMGEFFYDENAAKPKSKTKAKGKAGKKKNGKSKKKKKK